MSVRFTPSFRALSWYSSRIVLHPDCSSSAFVMESGLSTLRSSLFALLGCIVVGIAAAFLIAFSKDPQILLARIEMINHVCVILALITAALSLFITRQATQSFIFFIGLFLSFFVPLLTFLLLFSLWNAQRTMLLAAGMSESSLIPPQFGIKEQQSRKDSSSLASKILKRVLLCILLIVGGFILVLSYVLVRYGVPEHAFQNILQKL